MEGAVVHVPRGATGRPPLVLAFHGVGDTAQAFGRWTGLSRLSDRRGFVVAYPEMSGPRMWQLDHGMGDEDVARTRRLIDRLRATACVSRARLYLTGFSNGGGFTARLACDLGRDVAAVAAVAGSYRAVEPCDRSGPPVAVMEVHGQDPFTATVPRLFATWTARDRCSAPRVERPRRGIRITRWQACPVERVALAGTGHVWPGAAPSPRDPTGFRASDEVWSFLRRHRRCGPALCRAA